ncbi:MAG: nucleotidyltransferase family protein [Erysipelotrichaceae bacterium]|nr:nucleotidyltransferase family protein [Erysipelotrichaceae bacterium]
MKAVGIIVEYNPLHKGHKLHIEKTKEITKPDVLIAVMSGNFVQRGEPAIIDKWKRAKAAILNGVDLVIELPYVFSVQSATQFAYGAVKCLNLAGVSDIVFGSESNNLEELIEISKTSINADNLKESLSVGNSFVKSYGLLSKTMQPNDILAVAYLKEILKTNIKPHTIQRTNHYHDLSIQEISSASAIRNAFLNGTKCESSLMYDELTNGELMTLNKFYPLIRYLLLTLEKKYLQEIFLVSEGIENHLIKQALISENLDIFLKNSTTKRYTSSRIKRILIHLINHIKKEDIKKLEELNTIRILAMNNKGRNYLKSLKNVNIASRFSKIQDGYREIEYKSCLTYASMLKEKNHHELIKNEIGGLIYINM